MKKIIFGILIIITISIILILNEPMITLKGNEEVNLNLNDKYKEIGYIGKTRLKNKTKKVLVTDNINNKKIGVYNIKYELRVLFNKTIVTRKINVIDTIKPIIELNGSKEIHMCPSGTYNEEGYKAYDNYDKDITKKVKIKKTDSEIIYSVKDSSNNEQSVIRKIVSVDQSKPTLILKGNEVETIRRGKEFIEPGYSAIDDCDNDISDKVIKIGYIDTSKIGPNEIKYVVKDSSGNETIKTRLVYVVDKDRYNGGIIFLTFDDGPSSDITPTILDILKEENIKATFFVTNKDDSLNNLIKREYNDGHTVALHTATHDYSYVYSSVENYFNDLNIISTKVKNITGIESKIIRFPGGSSNTVSRRYNLGIMTELVNKVKEQGYNYYDWNFDSEDATRKYDSSGIYNNVTLSLKPGKNNVVLMHDFVRNNPTKEALKNIIHYGKENGYIFSNIKMDTPEVHHYVAN